MDTPVKNRTYLTDLATMDAIQVSRLPVDQLTELADDLDEMKAKTKRLGDLLATALHQRFGDPADALRRADGKDTGRVHLTENGCEIIADLPKKTAWDQAKLADAVAAVRAWGEDPADYVSTEMSVPEARFNA